MVSEENGWEEIKTLLLGGSPDDEATLGSAADLDAMADKVSTALALTLETLSDLCTGASVAHSSRGSLALERGERVSRAAGGVGGKVLGPQGIVSLTRDVPRERMRIGDFLGKTEGAVESLASLASAMAAMDATEAILNTLPSVVGDGDADEEYGKIARGIDGSLCQDFPGRKGAIEAGKGGGAGGAIGWCGSTLGSVGERLKEMRVPPPDHVVVRHERLSSQVSSRASEIWKGLVSMRDGSLVIQSGHSLSSMLALNPPLEPVCRFAVSIFERCLREMRPALSGGDPFVLSVGGAGNHSNNTSDACDATGDGSMPTPAGVLNSVCEALENGIMRIFGGEGGGVAAGIIAGPLANAVSKFLAAVINQDASDGSYYPPGVVDGVEGIARVLGDVGKRDFEMPQRMVSEGRKWAVRKRASVAVALARDIITGETGEFVDNGAGDRGLFAAVRPTERVIRLRDLMDGLIPSAGGDAETDHELSMALESIVHLFPLLAGPTAVSRRSSPGLHLVPWSEATWLAEWLSVRGAPPGLSVALELAADDILRSEVRRQCDVAREKAGDVADAISIGATPEAALEGINAHLRRLREQLKVSLPPMGVAAVLGKVAGAALTETVEIFLSSRSASGAGDALAAHLSSLEETVSDVGVPAHAISGWEEASRLANR